MNQPAYDLNPDRVACHPFDFGDIVYFKCRTQKIPGMVIGFVYVSGSPGKVLVKWGDDAQQMEHFLIELTTEYEPDFSSS